MLAVRLPQTGPLVYLFLTEVRRRDAGRADRRIARTGAESFLAVIPPTYLRFEW